MCDDGNKLLDCVFVQEWISLRRQEQTFRQFWDYIERFSRKNLILLLCGACDNKPIPSLDHLAVELFIAERTLGVDNGPITGDKLNFILSGGN